VTLSFGLRLKSQTKLQAKTKVWSETKLNLSSLVLDQSIAIHLDRQTALIP